VNCIDYGFLDAALKQYSKLGYQRIEVPWWVTADIANVTKPTGVSASNNYKLSVNGKCLVASGEQSFLYLANKGQLPPGKYQAVTPCFRNEEYDVEHSKQFIKLELIQLMPPGEFVKQDLVEHVADDALGLFKSLAVGSAKHCRIIETGVVDPLAPFPTKQLDVVMAITQPDGSARDVELGSYGARRSAFATWIYGTGIAEPRFSKTLRQVT
jgi:hypothetical protein